MTVSTLLEGVEVLNVLEPALAERLVSGLAYDSRLVELDNLFFAFPGARLDGRRFAADAIAKGAVAIVSESVRPDGFTSPWIQVAHGRKALAAASKIFYGAPDERLFVAAITGTNGKTTTSYLIDAIVRAAGFKTSLVGTIGYHVAGRPLPAVNTTPESLDLFRLLDQSVREGVRYFIFENSSHAQALGRSYGLFVHTAVFTNLTRDHLDFHFTMEAYFDAKTRMFAPQAAAAPRAAVINHDDEWGRKIPLAESTQAYWYGLHPGAGYRAVDIHNDFSGLRFNIQTPAGDLVPIESPLVGQINVYNILSAFCCGLSFGLDPLVIASGVAQCPAVPGRFERIDEGQRFLVAVDYAHTDDAIRNVVAVARSLNPKRVITLFGCGGDRDRTKRPLMGKAAAEASDFIVLTSDNPRSEDPTRIIEDVLPGIEPYSTPRLIEPDRETAIRLALQQAEPGDIVLLTGKGCETYQVLADRTIDFDDREVARRLLREMGHQ